MHESMCQFTACTRSHSAYNLFTYFHRDAKQCFAELKQKVDDSWIRKILSNISWIHSATNTAV